MSKQNMYFCNMLEISYRFNRWFYILYSFTMTHGTLNELW